MDLQHGRATGAVLTAPFAVAPDARRERDAMASRVVAVGLSCTTWVAGVVGGLGEGRGR